MIPLQVTMDGFLSYREKEEFDFTNSTLWMLSGDNGAGKSSVFDAMTFALFGQHRGGSQNAKDLINWHRDKFSVAYDFEIAGETFRAERTVEKKGTATRRLRRLNKESHWEDLPNSTDAEGFKKHISAILGLRYETFTTSALLQQGKVDRLLEVDPKDRFELLSQIVNLSEYAALHDSSKRCQTNYKAKTDSENDRLHGMTQVSDAEIATAETAAGIATEAEKAAQKRVHDYAGWVIQAKDWEKLTAERKSLKDKIADAERLIAGEKAVRANAARHIDLTAALRPLTHLRDARKSLHEAESDYQTACDTVAALVALFEARIKLTAPDVPLTEKVNWCKLRLQDETEDCAAAQSALPHLQRMAEERGNALTAQVTVTRLEGETKLAPPLPATEKIACATEILAEVNAQVSVTAAFGELAKFTAQGKALGERIERLKQAAGSGEEALCHYCEQPLSPENLHSQQARLMEEKKQCDKDTTVAKAENKRCDDALKAASAAFASARQAYQTVCETYRNRAQNLQTAQGHFTLAKTNAQNAANNLSPGKWFDEAQKLFAVEDSSQTAWPNDLSGFPTADEIATVKAKADALTALRTEADASNDAQNKVNVTKATLDGAVKNGETAAKVVSGAWLVWYDAQPTEQDSLIALTKELKSLVSSTKQLQELEASLLNRTEWIAAHTRCQSSIDTLPEQAKRSLTEIEAEQKIAVAALEKAKITLREALSLVEALERAKAEYKETVRRRDEFSLKAGLYKTLTDLLGRDNLQAFLLRGAEEAIVGYANEALAEFSQSSLRLEARPEGKGVSKEAKALDLVCANTQCAGEGAVLPLSNLSGSQKFRVAVALALGIGRFAGHSGGGRIESVIIDEGFGSLDRNNQHDMADAIRSLAGNNYLKRIIVVSHQEAFAEGFPDRIHVALGPNGSHRGDPPTLV